ncbi:MAG: hypothetical protein V1897_16295 [Pseudomonadota bacterium]
MNNLMEIFRSAIISCIEGHANHAKRGNTRKWDKKTPYAIHPLWCAITFLQETKLSGDAKRRRVQCALALLFHDFKEDTTAVLPQWLPRGTVELVNSMTFSVEADSTVIEMRQVWKRLPIVRLLKLDDKVSNLMDGVWMSDEKWNTQYVPYVLQLATDVERNYGDLNIVRVARAVAVLRPAE